MTGQTEVEPIRVLLVDDDDEVYDVIEAGFSVKSFSLTRAATLADARRKLAGRTFDVLVLDIHLPDGSGMDIARELRQTGSNLPIVILTARDQVDDRVEGLGTGADDYLCKPFAVEELVARIHAVLRRLKGAAQFVLQFDDIELDLMKRRARRQDVDAELSARETDLLAYFMRHPNEPLDRERLLEEIWGDEAEDGSNVLNVYVNYLRNKLEKGLYSRVIHTVRGVGYMLSESPPDSPER